MSNIEGISLSVTGFSHFKESKECQDFSSHIVNSGYAIGVVCDGHGDTKYFRSAKGSEFAAKVSNESIQELLKYGRAFPGDKDSLLLQLQKSIITNWNNAIREHLKANPFSEKELSSLSDKEREQILRNVESAYGSTLLAMVLTDSECWGVQIGDGDCVLLNEEGDFFNPVPGDDSLRFNITSSLCGKNAIHKFRNFWLDDSITAVILSTDGVKNSFENEDFFLKFCFTILENIGEVGKREATFELAGYMEELSEKGSGDDMSVAILYKKNMLPKSLKRYEEKVGQIEYRVLNTISDDAE